MLYHTEYRCLQCRMLVLHCGRDLFRLVLGSEPTLSAVLGSMGVFTSGLPLTFCWAG